MARANKSRYAVLGILTFGPKSGYDIRKLFQLGPGHFWRESYGQIYPILRKLLAEGMVKQRVQQTAGRPARKVYSLTAKGRKALRDWLPAEPEPQSPRNELLLKLFFGRNAGKAACARHVKRARDRSLALRERYDGIESHLRARLKDDPDAVFQLITLRYGQRIVGSLIDWCDEALALLA
jgi:DNA-binding PadR family transcriptional regulator